MRVTSRVALLSQLALVSFSAATSAAERLTVRVANDLAIARPSETVVLEVAPIVTQLGAQDPRAIHAVDAANGVELLTQLVDIDGNGIPDQLLFQLDLEPRATRRVFLARGEPRHPKAADFRAYGRFVRERFDDFVWENDRVAFRMYGKALESWQREPLTSSAVDTWCKRTRRLVANDWYMVDDYHRDSGEGADLYSAGKSRGCGGSGLWVDGALSVSRNFVESKVVAAGPIRVIFELVYEPWLVKGSRVAEVKRITLDAGANLSRFESSYLMLKGQELLVAAGIKKATGASLLARAQAGWLRTWEALKDDNGHLGCAVVCDPAQWVQAAEDELNHLVVIRAPGGLPVSYYAGSGWDKGGDFGDVSDWERYVDQFAQRLRAPLRVEVGAE